MPFHNIPGSSEQYALVNFNDDGQERPEGGGLFSTQLLEKARQEKPTNIFFFSHGWKGDVPAAIDQYNRWIGAMAALSADRARMGADFKPMWIGLHWPSQPFGEEGASGQSFDVGDGGTSELEAAVAHFGGGDAVRKPLEIIFQAAIDEAGAIEVPPAVDKAYRDLAAAIGFKAGGSPSAAPDEEGAALDPQLALEATNAAGASFGIGSKLLNGLKGGLRQLSFWKMKKRARSVGEAGMHQFIAALMRDTKASIHLMGHSFGCIVTSGILAGRDGKTPLPRPVASVALVQGAVSLWSWAEAGKVPKSAAPGYFHGIVSRKAVSGPVVTTQSRFDIAVGSLYPVAVSLVGGDLSFKPEVLPDFGALGTYGIRGTASEQIKMLPATSDYNFAPGAIYNINSDAFIKKMDGASGSHSDIDGPEVAHAIWQAALAGQQKELASHA
jgi:hypothetical protein